MRTKIGEALTFAGLGSDCLDGGFIRVREEYRGEETGNRTTVEYYFDRYGNRLEPAEYNEIIK